MAGLRSLSDWATTVVRPKTAFRRAAAGAYVTIPALASTRRSFPAPPRHARAVVLSAHPHPESFNRALAAAWVKGAETKGVAVEHIDVNALDFDPCRAGGYADESPLEPDLMRVQRAIADAAHVVVAFPLWWGSTPAVLKGLFDRAFLPGWAFRYDAGKTFPVPGLAGRSARVLVTMDAPGWYNAMMFRSSAQRQVARATLRFCGLKPVQVSTFGGVGERNAAQRAKMLAVAHRAGEKDGAAVARRVSAGLGVTADA